MNVSVENATALWNVSLEAYLLDTRGPKHLDLHIVLPITIVYALIFVTGVVGNVAVCAVIVRTAEMHTATNYYLFSLAISDLALLLLGLPNDLSVYWQQYPWALGEALCKFRAVVSEMMSYTSVLTIVAFSMERYLAICHPLYSYSMKGLRRALRIIAVVWMISLVSAVPFAVYTTVSYVEYPPAAVVVAFFLCWAPFHLQRLLYIHGKGCPNFREINEWLFYITGCFYYLSSTVNPILYNVMSAKYRDAFLKTLFCKESPRKGVSRDTFSNHDSSSGYNNSVLRSTNSRKKHKQTLETMKEEGLNKLLADVTSDILVVATNGKATSYIAPRSNAENSECDKASGLLNGAQKETYL
ncbi:neuropeptides capa receptor isoform X2 [Anabrus simplex]|uniref:neuropeptides capa receptor isoform X2 n=1 Tax=Anabrus simplex TaxID=316456 RepID=UPI0035A3B817